MTVVSIITPCFRSERYLGGYFDAVLKQSALDRLEVVLVLNEPSPEELDAVDRFEDGHPGIVRRIILPCDWTVNRAVERGARSITSVSESMNRAAEAARGSLIALWNVDDVRVPDSIAWQIATLNTNPDAAMTYGDMTVVREYGGMEGELVVAPEFDRNLFMRGCFGAFQMWRKVAFDSSGPFDEQLQSGADYDLWVRLAANGPLVRTPRMLGYYTNAGTGLSTCPDGLQPTERTVIELRYGILDKVDRRYLSRAARYRVGEIKYRGEWLSVERFVPGLDDILNESAADPRVQPAVRVSRAERHLRGIARWGRSVLRGGRDSA